MGKEGKGKRKGKEEEKGEGWERGDGVLLSGGDRRPCTPPISGLDYFETELPTSVISVQEIISISILIKFSDNIFLYGTLLTELYCNQLQY